MVWHVGTFLPGPMKRINTTGNNAEQVVINTDITFHRFVRYELVTAQLWDGLVTCPVAHLTWSLADGHVTQRF